LTEPTPSPFCRSCGSRALEALIDLGQQPDPDWLLDPAGSDAAPEAPVRLAMCSICALVQLVGPRPDGRPPTHGHVAPPPTTDPWSTRIAAALSTGDDAVVDVDGSSGLASALAGGRPVIAGPKLGVASQAGLILAGHALAHADDLDGLVARMAIALAPRGLIAIDFHHALGIANGQFDVLAHTHRSYLSLHSLEWSLRRHGLAVIATQRSDAFGGTIRVLAARPEDGGPAEMGGSDSDAIRRLEREARIDQPTGFHGLEDQVRVACAAILGFLDEARRTGRTVAGYGAAARGTVLLNLAGIGSDLLPFVVDRAPAKQHRLLPRARIPVLAPSEIERRRPQEILILPWPMAAAISDDLAFARRWGARFTVALPRLTSLT
jgi:hypothetical protein